MNSAINFLLVLVVATAILLLISGYQALKDHIKEVSEYEARIKELTELLDEQERRRQAEFNALVASGEKDPEQRAYFVARAISAIKK